MDLSKFTKQKTGQLVEISGTGKATHAFIPDPLPPDWLWPAELWPLLLKAREELARLDGVGRHLPNPELLLKPMQNREAQRSSSLEGTYASPQQLALFEMAPTDAILQVHEIQAATEVMNYARALRYWGESKNRIPLSLRLIRNLHRILLEGVRGEQATPGEFRRGQVQIGGEARFVPPPWDALAGCLDRLEKYLHQEKTYDPLVEVFLVHYQFETIHPFFDGNGRVGRLLLSITLQEWCGLSQQWLYMSAYFDRHKDEYIDRLFEVSANGDWSGWVRFCLQGVVEQSIDTQQRCSKLLSLRDSYKDRLARENCSGRLVLMLDDLFIQPVTTTTMVKDKYGVSYPTARSDLECLVGVGVLTPVQLKQRRQVGYYCEDIFRITYEEN